MPPMMPLILPISAKTTSMTLQFRPYQADVDFSQSAPDFVLELRSESDRLADLQEKMEEYRDNGVRLGWLIDPQNKQVFVYRPGQSTIHYQNPTSLSGDPELSGFELDLNEIWTV